MIQILLLAVFISLNGCTSTGKVTKIELPEIMKLNFQNLDSSISVNVSGFESKQASPKIMGQHAHLFGRITHFNLMDGKIETGVSQNFKNYLKEAGFEVSSENDSVADININGNITKLSVAATEALLSTHLRIDAILEFVISNKNDGSILHLRIGTAGTDDIIGYFKPENIERLLDEVLNEGFKTLLEKTFLQGHNIRRKL